MFKKLLLTAALSMGLSGFAAAATEGVDYAVLPKVMEQAQKDKVEVLEFFGYFCVHCKNLDPIILKYAKAMPADTYFQTEHVVWDEQGHMGFARLAAAVNQADLKQTANPAIFKAIFEDKINLNDPATTIKWINEQKSFDSKKLLSAYNSFSNQAQAKQMAAKTAEFGIDSTPTVIVGGKYRLLFPKGFAAGMQTIDELVQKVRDERGMKKPSATPSKAQTSTPKGKGAGFAGAANR